MTSVADQGPIGRRGWAAWNRVRVARWLPLLTVLAAAIGLRLVVVANTDVSWLITLSEKVLDGQRLYADLVELNPPASVTRSVTSNRVGNPEGASKIWIGFA